MSKSKRSSLSIYISLFAIIGLFVIGILFDPKSREADNNAESLVADHSSFNGQKFSLPALSGEKAITHLKQNGMYSSLGEAVTAAHYKAEKIDERVVALNYANGLKAEFDDTGVKLSSTSKTALWQSKWRLQSIGYGDEQTAIKRGELGSKGQRVEIRREEADLIEWFENKPGGLEHGFTLSERPQTKHNPTEFLRLVMEVGGDLKAEANKNGQGLNLTDGKGKEVIRYKKLKVWDAHNKEQTARMHVSDTKVILEVEDANAKYPLTIDPIFETTKLLASDGAEGDFFGISVSISGDTAVVGAWGDDDDNNFGPGAAYIFERHGTIWTEKAKLRASDEVSGIQFGISVSISGDTVMVGATSESFQGAGYIYVRDGAGVWTEQAKLTPSDRANADSFGQISVSMVSISGDTAILGSHGDDDIDGQDSGYIHTNSGSAYIFVRNGTTWTEQAKLRASDGAAGDEFGLSVSISGDTAAVGAWGDDGALGAAYIYVRDAAGLWTEQAKLTASDGAAGDQFGYSVSISGNTAIAGAHFDDDNGTDSGSAYVFVRDAGVWTEQQKLMASDGPHFFYFGYSVVIDEDNDDKLIVGSLYDWNDVPASGSAYVFVRNAGVWTKHSKLIASVGVFQARFGYSVSISGSTAIVGAWGDDDFGESSGSAYVFSRAPEDLIVELTADIEDLADQGALSSSHGRALTSKLNSAIKQLKMGNTNAALQKLNAVITQTQGFIFVGHISPEDGQAIIDATQAIIDSISS